jgi:hypothetical protein
MLSPAKQARDAVSTVLIPSIAEGPTLLMYENIFPQAGDSPHICSPGCCFPRNHFNARAGRIR